MHARKGRAGVVPALTRRRDGKRKCIKSLVQHHFQPIYYSRDIHQYFKTLPSFSTPQNQGQTLQTLIKFVPRSSTRSAARRTRCERRCSLALYVKRARVCAIGRP
jgi:hypothetical protein